MDYSKKYYQNRLLQATPEKHYPDGPSLKTLSKLITPKRHYPNGLSLKTLSMMN